MRSKLHIKVGVVVLRDFLLFFYFDFGAIGMRDFLVLWAHPHFSPLRFLFDNVTFPSPICNGWLMMPHVIICSMRYYAVRHEAF